MQKQIQRVTDANARDLQSKDQTIAELRKMNNSLQTQLRESRQVCSQAISKYNIQSVRFLFNVSSFDRPL